MGGSDVAISATRGAGRGRRRDIEGLRAVAVAAVVVYHARPSLLSGGYVGVDVFFVVSGFVITSMLWGELEDRGSISLGRFYAGRVRRLLPASAIVIATTVGVSAIVLSPLQLTAVAKDAVAAAFYVANYRFAAEASNYLTASGPLSPLQHYWSLGVEEQFYLIWPLLLVAASLVWRRRPPSRRAAALVVAVLAAASFALCWHLTAVDEPWAFYALAPRAFELGLGALLALAEPRVAALGRRWPELAAAAGWTGLALVVASTVRLGATTPFPGAAVLAPVLGAAAVIAGGCAPARAGAGLLLERRPLQWLGGVSYTVYLWHYPVLVLAPDVLGRALDPLDDVVAVGFALALAVLTTLFVERPVRYSSFLAPRRGLSLLTGGALSCAAAAIAVLVAASLPALPGSGSGTAQLGVPLAAGAESPTGIISDGRTLSDPGGGDPSYIPDTPAGRAALANDVVEAAVSEAGRARSVPTDVQPPLADASADEPYPFVDGCFDSFLDTEVNSCLYGDTTASRSVVLFGDSHALMWFPAIDAIAEQHHVQLVALAKATCPPLDLEVFSPDLDEWYWQCDDWRQAALERIEALRPAVVILGFSREYGVNNDHVEVYGNAWMSGLAEMIEDLRASGAKVVVIGPVPYPPFLVPDCLAQYLEDPTQCSMPDEAPWYDASGVRAEEAVVSRAGASYVDVQRWFCTATRCLTMIDGMVAYRDDNHLSATYASWLTPAMAAELELATDGSF